MFADKSSLPKEFIKSKNNLDEVYSFYEKNKDIWYKIPLYGKVDTKGNSVRVKESNLKLINSFKEPKLLYLINFAADAYKDLRLEYEELYRSGYINKNSKYFKESLSPTKAWERDGYDDHVESFLQVMTSEKEDELKFSNKILNFNDFIKFLEIFLIEKNKTSTTSLPLTREGYYETVDKTYFSTGLFLQLFNISNDFDKNVDEFYNDPNFGFYQKFVTKFGFKIDKQRPWVIICDIESKTTEKYINFYRPGFLPDIAFEDSYVKYSGLSLFKEFENICLSLYNSILIAYEESFRPREDWKLCKDSIQLGFSKRSTEIEKNKDFYSKLLRLYHISRIVERDLSLQKIISEKEISALLKPGIKIGTPLVLDHIQKMIGSFAWVEYKS